ncbi:hypothetical protein KFL_002530080 [Klebsormidium nitens]|uniref:Uncharacterized protein n=1 Tax=Klebsormidium nitens TaxID=105231 RepID=A0A1Y1I5J8_KLENI|nr:hypothetical protein KFL_002530080 [Klebsormidium nitens]|eukprot:GAQ85763.1 hypothetical protein KFL_002530080 [Klebsormidium nitens]
MKLSNEMRQLACGGSCGRQLGPSEKSRQWPAATFYGRRPERNVATAALTTDVAAALTSASQQDYRAAPQALAAVPELQELAACDDTDLLHLFFLVFCSQGVGMTEKVEMWIRRAGQECLALANAGSDVEMLQELGNSLVEGALEEAGHDRWFRNDVTKLSASWNAKHPGSPMSADALLTSPYFQSVHDYDELHDRYIASKQPYAQVAIQSAIEQLSLVLGAPMIARVRALLGDAFLPQLTFLHHHVVLDVTHAAESAELRDKFVEANPRLEPQFAEATFGVLDVYGRFLGECWNKAKKMRAALVLE